MISSGPLRRTTSQPLSQPAFSMRDRSRAFICPEGSFDPEIPSSLELICVLVGDQLFPLQASHDDSGSDSDFAGESTYSRLAEGGLALQPSPVVWRNEEIGCPSVSLLFARVLIGRRASTAPRCTGHRGRRALWRRRRRGAARAHRSRRSGPRGGSSRDRSRGSWGVEINAVGATTTGTRPRPKKERG